MSNSMTSSVKQIEIVFISVQWQFDNNFQGELIASRYELLYISQELTVTLLCHKNSFPMHVLLLYVSKLSIAYTYNW